MSLTKKTEFPFFVFPLFSGVAVARQVCMRWNLWRAWCWKEKELWANNQRQKGHVDSVWFHCRLLGVTISQDKIAAKAISASTQRTCIKKQAVQHSSAHQCKKPCLLWQFYFASLSDPFKSCLKCESWTAEHSRFCTVPGMASFADLSPVF